MKERITYGNYVQVSLKYTDPAGERAYGPAWYEIMKTEEEYVKQERYNAYMCGMNNLGYHDTYEMMFFNSICMWGDNGPANTSGGHDNSGTGNGYDIPKTQEGQTPKQEGDGGGKATYGEVKSVTQYDNGTVVTEYENGMKETRYSDGRILIQDIVSECGYIVIDLSATQMASFNMNYYILYNPSETSLCIFCLSSNSEVIAGDVFAGAGATVIAGDEYSKYESLLGDNQAHLYGEDWNYVGSAKFMIPSDCGTIQINMIGNWSVNTGYGITQPINHPVLCPFPINANINYYIKP